MNTRRETPSRTHRRVLDDGRTEMDFRQHVMNQDVSCVATEATSAVLTGDVHSWMLLDAGASAGILRFKGEMR